MKFIGRDLDLNFAWNMFKKHPYSCIIQGLQKLRQSSKIDYNLLQGKSLPPTIITFEVTHKCNLRCKTCWFWGENGKYSKGGYFEEMTLEEIKRFINSVKKFKPYFLLTGGEPLLKKDIEEIVRYASSKGLFVGLITNGMLANKEKIKKIIDAGLNFITISVDSPEEKTHNSIRGNKNSFENCIAAVKMIKELRKTQFPFITINLTISKYNYKNLDKMLDLAENLGVNILQFQHQWFSDSKNANAYSTWAKKNLNLESEHVGNFKTNAYEIEGNILYNNLNSVRIKSSCNKKTYARIFPDMTEEETIKYYKGMKPVYTDKCINPWSGIIIKPNGDVVPCIDYVVGNVKKDPFPKIWNSNKMKKFRSIVKKQKYFPGCTRCCGFFQK